MFLVTNTLSLFFYSTDSSAFTRPWLQKGGRTERKVELKEIQHS